MTPQVPDSPALHRAAWVVPLSTPAIANGAVLVENGIILAVGPVRELEARSPAGTEKVDHGPAALIPALVNAHTHLELTALELEIPLPQESFSRWLTELMSRRDQVTLEALRLGLLEGQRRLREAGTVLCGDITNGVCIGGAPTSGTIPGRQVFLEVLGFNRDGLNAVVEPALLRELDAPTGKSPCASLAAHACYSTSGGLIRAAKEWCRSRGRVFSIHAAEHAEEVEFLHRGTGFCRDLLESLGKWVPGWEPPEATPVGYLEYLGVLDAHTLLVHAVHTTDADWGIVARRKCAVCFCPRSNHYLSVGRPRIEEALQRNITVALGTDSLASNTDLCLFNEAAFVLENYPRIPPGAVLSMITLGGAKALQQTSRFGSITPGGIAALLSVSLPYLPPSERLEAAIIHQGAKGEWYWVNCL